MNQSNTTYKVGERVSVEVVRIHPNRIFVRR